jgi:hypothetical protein
MEPTRPVHPDAARLIRRRYVAIDGTLAFHLMAVPQK